MADIRQAAKWVQEGNRIRRPCIASEISIGNCDGRNASSWWLVIYEGPYRARDKREAIFTCEDLLADDWEIAK